MNCIQQIRQIKSEVLEEMFDIGADTSRKAKALTRWVDNLDLESQIKKLMERHVIWENRRHGWAEKDAVVTYGAEKYGRWIDVTIDRRYFRKLTSPSKWFWLVLGGSIIVSDKNNRLIKRYDLPRFHPRDINNLIKKNGRKKYDMYWGKFMARLNGLLGDIRRDLKKETEESCLRVSNFLEICRMRNAIMESSALTLSPAWVKGIRLWWKQWVNDGYMLAKGHKFTDDKTTEDTRKKYLFDHINRGVIKINALKDDIWYSKGLWPLLSSGEKKTDIKLDKKFGAPRNKIAYDISDALAELQKLKDRMGFWFDAALKQGTIEYEANPEVRETKWGKSGKKNMWEVAVTEDFPEYIKKVDSIVSGKVLRALSALAKKISDASGKHKVPWGMHPTEKEYNVGRMKVVIIPYHGMIKSTINIRHLLDTKKRQNVMDRRDVPYVSPSVGREMVKYVQKAQQMIGRSGFKFLWYGKMFVLASSEAPVNPTFKEPGHYASGIYNIQKDTISCFEGPSNFVTELIIHELGHRYFYKFMKKKDRLGFMSWFKKVPAVSAYGGLKDAEDFAEVFAWYVMGRKLTRDQRQRFKQFALPSGRARKHEDIFSMADVVFVEAM